MRKINDLNLYKTPKKYSRIEKLNRLIKKLLERFFCLKILEIVTEQVYLFL